MKSDLITIVLPGCSDLCLFKMIGANMIAFTKPLKSCDATGPVDRTGLLFNRFLREVFFRFT